MRLSDLYDPQEWRAKLYAILARRYLRMLEAVNAAIGSVFQLSPLEFRVDDEATRAMLRLAADQVVLIDRSTREQLRDVLREGQRRGYSDFEIAHGVLAEGFGGIDGLYLDSWKGRAETIARNEIAEAQHQSALDRYRATGLVERVQLVEHEDTDEPCASRNGQIVPLSSNPQRLHVNCRLGLIPVVDEGAA